MKNRESLFEYVIRIGDSNLILGHRLSEWCGHGPILEEDIAMINIALDLIGQATSYLKLAGKIEDKGRSEDDLAYMRNERDFKNFLLTEQPNGHFGDTIARQFLYDAFNYHFTEALCQSNDPDIKAIAEKSLKEITYHLRHSSEWIIRLGDGTDESHEKIQNSIDVLWKFTYEMFEADDVDEEMRKSGIGTDLKEIKSLWDKTVNDVLTEATLNRPEEQWAQIGAKKGLHTEHMGFILAEMQSVQRAYPGNKW